MVALFVLNSSLLIVGAVWFVFVCWFSFVLCGFNILYVPGFMVCAGRLPLY